MTSAATGPFAVRQAVVALNLGGGDEAVLGYLDFLSEKVSMGGIYFVHVLPRLDLFNALYEMGREELAGNYELNRELIERMEAKIKLRPAAQKSGHVRFEVREGNPLEELLQEASDQGADLVVIGQRSGAEHHGILARNLARKIKCSALIIPEKARKRLRNILVPVDFSAHSVKALQTALAIGKSMGEAVRITCLNIFEMPNLSVYKIQKSRQELKQIIREDRESAFRDFFSKYAAGEEDRIKTALVERQVHGIASYLLEYARENDQDLIVMGAHGHSKVELLLLGSVTEKLLSGNDRIPTLVVKEESGTIP